MFTFLKQRINLFVPCGCDSRKPNLVLATENKPNSLQVPDTAEKFTRSTRKRVNHRRASQPLLTLPTFPSFPLPGSANDKVDGQEALKKFRSAVKRYMLLLCAVKNSQDDAKKKLDLLSRQNSSRKVEHFFGEKDASKYHEAKLLERTKQLKLHLQSLEIRQKELKKTLDVEIHKENEHHETLAQQIEQTKIERSILSKRRHATDSILNEWAEVKPLLPTRDQSKSLFDQIQRRRRATMKLTRLFEDKLCKQQDLNLNETLGSDRDQCISPPAEDAEVANILLPKKQTGTGEVTTPEILPRTSRQRKTSISLSQLQAQNMSAEMLKRLDNSDATTCKQNKVPALNRFKHKRSNAQHQFILETMASNNRSFSSTSSSNSPDDLSGVVPSPTITRSSSPMSLRRILPVMSREQSVNLNVQLKPTNSLSRSANISPLYSPLMKTRTLVTSRKEFPNTTSEQSNITRIQVEGRKPPNLNVPKSVSPQN